MRQLRNSWVSWVDASARLQENPAVASTFCNAFQSPCRGEMQQQSLAPWGGHSWTAGSDFCMLIQLHDYVIIHCIALLNRIIVTFQYRVP